MSEDAALIASSIDRLSDVMGQILHPVTDPEPPPDPLSEDILTILAAGKHIQLGTTENGEAYIRLLAFDGTGAQMYQGEITRIVRRVRKGLHK